MNVGQAESNVIRKEVVDIREVGGDGGTYIANIPIDMGSNNNDVRGVKTRYCSFHESVKYGSYMRSNMSIHFLMINFCIKTFSPDITSNILFIPNYWVYRCRSPSNQSCSTPF